MEHTSSVFAVTVTTGDKQGNMSYPATLNVPYEFPRSNILLVKSLCSQNSWLHFSWPLLPSTSAGLYWKRWELPHSSSVTHNSNLAVRVKALLFAQAVQWWLETSWLLQSQLFQLLKHTSEDLQLGSAVKATTKTIPNSLITTPAVRCASNISRATAVLAILIFLPNQFLHLYAILSTSEK